jgi:hypothetical protein
VSLQFFVKLLLDKVHIRMLRHRYFPAQGRMSRCSDGFTDELTAE